MLKRQGKARQQGQGMLLLNNVGLGECNSNQTLFASLKFFRSSLQYMPVRLLRPNSENLDDFRKLTTIHRAIMADIKQPLLAAQKQDGETKTAPPPPQPAPAAKKKGPWNGCCSCMGSFEGTMTKALERSLGILLPGLLLATYVAVSMHCVGPFWPAFLFSCKIDPGAYQTLNGSGHPEW